MSSPLNVLNNSCKGKQHGHNFPYPGGQCLNCGIIQKNLSVLKISDKTGKTKNLHSKNHLLADIISKHMNEPKKFAMYLGIISRIGFNAANQIFSEIKQSKVKEKNKLFMWKARKLNQKSSTKK